MTRKAPLPSALPDAWAHQTAYAVRMAWGPRGAYEAARRADVVVLVDVLSFSTAVTAALDHGAGIVPFGMHDPEAAEAEAARRGLEYQPPGWGVGRQKRALYPRRFTKASRRKTYLLCSPNGAACTRIAANGGVVLLGCVRNATAAANRIAALAEEGERAITVVACGERWNPTPDAPEQGLRPCVEDLLGAGAIISALEGTRSPEAQLAADAFIGALRDLSGALHGCASGRELIDRGYARDVAFAADWDASTAVPVLDGDLFPAP